MSESSVNPLLLIGAGSSFVFSGLFYYLYQEGKKEIKNLKEIPLFRPDQQFVKALNATPHKRLRYVAVEGVVQADGEILRSQFVPRYSGVIQKITTEEHWKYLNRVTKTWNTRMVNRKETNNSVPFSLGSPGYYTSDVSVKVQNPTVASGSFLEKVYFNMRCTDEGEADVIMRVLNGEKPVSTVESEEMLRAGSTLTGFGEVVLEGSQMVRLQAPQDGSKYVLVPGDHKTYMDQHEASVGMWKMLTAVTGLTGASLLAGVIYNFAIQQDNRSV